MLSFPKNSNYSKKRALEGCFNPYTKDKPRDKMSQVENRKGVH